MLKYTVAACHKIDADLKRLAFVFDIITQAFFIIYPIYSIITDRGIFWINILISAISVSYLVFVVVTYKRNDKEANALKSTAKKIYTSIKCAAGAVSLAIMIYGVYFLVDNVTLLSLFLITCMAISWVLQIVLRFACYFVQSRAELFINGIEADFEKALEVKHGISNVIKMVKGEQIEDRGELISKKNREILMRQAQEDELRRKEARDAKDNWGKRIKRAIAARLRNEPESIEERTEEETAAKK